MTVVPQESQKARRSDAPKPQGLPEDRQLFANLLASKPPKQRRLGVWLIAGALHIPLLIYVWFAQISPRIEAWQGETYRTILVPEDRGAAMSGAKAPAVPKVNTAPPAAAAPAAPIRTLPSNPTPGIPQPTTPIAPPVAEPAGSGGVVGGSGRSLGERMTAPADPILFGRVYPAAPTGIAGVRERVAGSIQAINDSVAAEVAAAERATDWTVKDKDGKRWGVSPGKLHLGDITIPLPVAFATPAGRRDEMNGRLRSFNEIEAQSSRAQIKDSFEERVKAIRARKDRERNEKRKAVTTSNDE